MIGVSDSGSAQIRVRNSGLGSDRVQFGQNSQFQMWFESTRSTELTRSTQTMRVNSARCESTQRVRVRRFGSRLLFTCSDQVQQGQRFGPGQAASCQSSWNSTVRVRLSQTEPTGSNPVNSAGRLSQTVGQLSHTNRWNGTRIWNIVECTLASLVLETTSQSRI
ncbi:hypothetical protein HanXRQr2_Chr10g0431211 [Helianthus annuus]|uniref:Uncharacterized protein n=1 Tax=Helianthus annuus TaxID=4232 RepID=A0A9K3HWH3_HELAN|nr:hypothetical protein HanXRQr2_Chr10g0431211 [Helianthus annuus]KAJ0513187.1 hypothetical protein HanHA300_Chr10g0354561 [Helianthus annuus]KAJ0529311.1 hypothetical protein HanHA89_Chr10g0376251 [Helianthus annuus]KAJ0696195.1 hypothetical protein HanLR1_Chr10g0354131 [Helianthus annuus]